MGKTKKFMSLSLILPKIANSVKQNKNEGFQPLQGPYVRVVDIRFWYVCSRRCISLFCQGVRKQNTREEKKSPWRDMFLKNAYNHVWLLGHLEVTVDYEEKLKLMLII